MAGDAAAQITPTDELARYNEAMQNGVYAEAEVSAKVLLEQALREGGAGGSSTARPLIDLALAQRLNDDPATALQNYEAAIGVIESHTDKLNIDLIEPLLGVAACYIDSGQINLALLPIERALHVSQVNAGPHNLGQAETLELLADTYVQLGDYHEAALVADRLLLIYSRQFPGKSMELLPVLIRKGQILGNTGNRRDERNSYDAAVDIVKANEGSSSKYLIQPYINLGKSYEKEYFDLFVKAEGRQELPDERLLRNAESYLESAVAIAQDLEAEDWQLKVEAQLALADFRTLTGEHGLARGLYSSVWQTLSEPSDRLQQRELELGNVKLLLQPPIDLAVGLPFEVKNKPEEYDLGTGFITTQLTVTQQGRTKDIGLVEIWPERQELLESEVKRALTLFRYRPRFESGFAVETLVTPIRFEFPYLITQPENPKSP